MEESKLSPVYDIPVVPRKPLREVVHETLKAAIREGRFQLGERLNLDVLAQRLGVSRTPVKEALQKLEADGLVVSTSWKGFEIRKPTLEELEHVYEVREQLEGLCAALASKRRDARDLEAMGEALERGRDALEKNDRVQLALGLDDFYVALSLASHNPFLHETLDKCRHWMLLVRLSSTRAPGRWGAILSEHACILSAIERGDADEAQREAIAHLRNALASVRIVYGADGSG